MEPSTGSHAAGAAETHDYIIVGAGSAGCVLANRLSADGRHNVLLIEAGASDRSWKVQMPTAMMEPLHHPRYDWCLVSEPESGLDGRRLPFFRGRVLGGTSSINGMVYVRGHACDFDRWAHAEGCSGWSYPEVLPYFRRAETFDRGPNEYRGGDGPLHVRSPELANPLYRTFLDAGASAGYELTADINGYRREGFGQFDQMIHSGRRWNTANAYLRPALRRRNLTLLQQAEVVRITVTDDCARGVEVHSGGETRRIDANTEVILAAGALHSPLLLQRSGIGDPEMLAAAGIEAIVDLPGVGRDLQDHVEVPVQYACRRPVSLDTRLGTVARALIGLRWFLTRSGLGATNHFEAGAFIRSAAGVEHPDIELQFLPTTVDYDGTTASRPGFEALVDLLRPTSRGSVWPSPRDPNGSPAFRLDFLTTERDRTDMHRAVALTREIFSQDAFEPYRDEEIAPGHDVNTATELAAWIRAHAKPGYHATSSCRMGSADDPGAVLDPALRVRGIDALRVVDAASMPSNVSGNPIATIIMLAEKAADLILGRPPPEPAQVPVWVHPCWHDTQR